MTSSPSKGEVFLVDGFSLLFRAYYAIPHLTLENKMPVSALYGFLSSILKLVEEELASEICVALDSPGKGLRHDIFPDYKANRGDTPEDLLVQIQELPNVLRLLSIPTVRCDRYEADDIIAALACQIQKDGKKPVIVSADKDLMQLVQSDVAFYNISKNLRVGEQEVFEKFGVWPSQIKEYLMLVGDTSDNIPGVKGVGAKTAAALLQKFHNIAGIYDHFEELKPAQKRAFDAFRQFQEVSDYLVRLHNDAPVKLSEIDLWSGSTPESVQEVVETYEFHSLRGRLQNLIRSKESVSVSLQACEELVNNEQALLEEVESSGYLVCVNDNLWSSGEGGVYRGPVDSHIIRLLLQRKDIVKIFWGPSVNLSLEGDVEVLEVLLFLAYGVLNPEHLWTLPSFQHVFSTVYEENSRWVQLCAHGVAIFLKGMKQLFDAGLIGWYKTVELPLLPILHQLMQKGVCIDRELLEKTKNDLEQRLESLRDAIIQDAGREFNVGSSQQLAVVLYDEMNLVAERNTRSTDVRALEDLQGQHSIVDKILQWRHIHKLVTTYVAGLEKSVKDNGVVYTHFASTKTLTGRLNSYSPNLQNIPVKTEEGRQIRNCFVARPGKVLLAFDYSQIELRLLAHYAGDGPMQKAFLQNQDIHAATASLLYDVDVSAVSKEQRNTAKVVNFGVIYGMGVTALAQRLKVSKEEAGALLDTFGERYPDVIHYQKSMCAFAEKNGYVETIMGRRCYLPLMMSVNRQEKAHALRQAVNVPLQGSNADIMKKLMVQFASQHPDIMLLQVHDELICEVDADCQKDFAKQTISMMERVTALSVPVIVNVASGVSWGSLQPL